MSKLLEATAVAIIAALAALVAYSALSGCDRHRARAAIAALVYGDAEGVQVSAFAVSERSGTTVSELVDAMAAGYEIAHIEDVPPFGSACEVTLRPEGQQAWWRVGMYPRADEWVVNISRPE